MTKFEFRQAGIFFVLIVFVNVFSSFVQKNKYFHISNGNVTVKKFNPGFNANIFYICFSFYN